MKKILIVLLVLFMATGCSPAQNIDNEQHNVTEKIESTTKSTTLYLESLKLDSNYSVYLPEGFSVEEETNLPILYMLHGAFGNHAKYLESFPMKDMLDKKISEGTLDPMIVIFPDGYNSFYINGSGLQMEDAIIKDFIPGIEKELNNTPLRDNRYIGGLSMGGFGAANFALKYPDIFSKAILMSPAVWESVEPGFATEDWHIFRDENKDWDSNLWNQFHPTANFDSYKEKNLPVEFFVISGEKDEVTPIQSVKDFVSKLETVAEVETQYDPEGFHGWKYWESSTNDALDKFIGSSKIER